MKVILLFCKDAWTGFASGMLCPTAGNSSCTQVQNNKKELVLRLVPRTFTSFGDALCGDVPVHPALPPSQAFDSISCTCMQKTLQYQCWKPVLWGSFSILFTVKLSWVSQMLTVVKTQLHLLAGSFISGLAHFMKASWYPGLREMLLL